MWWIQYIGPDGLRHAESSLSARKGDAERLLQRRIGAREHNLPGHSTRRATDVHCRRSGRHRRLHDQQETQRCRRPTPYRETPRPVLSGPSDGWYHRADVAAYKVHRQQQGIKRWKNIAIADGTIERKLVRVSDVSNGEINRELQILKRIFSLAMKGGRLAMKPHIAMLKEAAPRSGFFEGDQLADVLAHLPMEIRPVIEFAAITGWRVASEILPLEWRHVDFGGGEIRLDAGTTKNGEPRTFPMTTDLRRLLKIQHAEHERLKKAGHLFPCVFFRLVADERGGEKKPRRIIAFTKAWKNACIAAGCPGRIPHDLRRSAVPGPRLYPRARGNDDDGPQDAIGIPALQHRQRMRPQGRGT